MSSISSIGAYSVPYKLVTPAATHPKPANAKGSATTGTITAGKDPDHDGDTDGPGLDVNG